MPRYSDSLGAPLAERIRAAFGQRLFAVALSLLLEVLLGILLLTLGRLAAPEEKRREVALVSFDARGSEEVTQPPAPPEPRASRGDARTVTPSSPQQDPQPPQPRPTAAAIIPLSRSEFASSDLARFAVKPGKPAAGPVMGPPGNAASADTPRVGTGPHGQALYAAAWYREPYEDELSGYLSTASGPGWGLIACRTAPEYRVKDCVALDEHPTGSNIARAVVAAAWQFRVRPPRIGGVPKVGDWVRIRIDYGIRAR